MLTFFCKGDEELLLVLEKEIICMNTDLKQKKLMLLDKQYQIGNWGNFSQSRPVKIII